mgnify:CR=1 FL=1
MTTTRIIAAPKENHISEAFTLEHQRPSLRVQGERRQQRKGGTILGAIPARAGRTRRATSASCNEAGHPCACRENKNYAHENESKKGPSLRVQKELSKFFILLRKQWAIPARAGRTRSRGGVRFLAKGHPCACRENGVGAAAGIVIAGPSLRVQGEPHIVVEAPAVVRAIPARAGRTRSPGRSQLGGRGHPCACRENRGTGAAPSEYEGPSLRVQGEQ